MQTHNSLSFTTASRTFMIQHLNTEFMAKDKDRYIFYFSKLCKIGGKVRSLQLYLFCFWWGKGIMCGANIKLIYINRSKPWRESNYEKQLLLISIRSRNVVVSCNISSYTLKQAGINTDLFKVYSTRSASISKASVGGAPLVEILKRGSWSHHFTRQRFYNKHIIQKGHVFQDMVY